MTEPGHPTRRPQTDQAYLDRGRALQRRAVAQHPKAEDSIHALVLMFSNPDWTLRPSTTRTYKAGIIKFIETEVEQGDCSPERAVQVLTDIDMLLAARRGRPEPRTSRKKAMDVRPEEVQAVCQDIRSRINDGDRDMTNTVVMLLAELQPRLGLRPCEWPRARLVGRTLVVINAKRSNGRAPGFARRISLERAPEAVLTGVRHLIAALRVLVTELGGWGRVHDVIAERLARVCGRLGLVRISLYSLRHVAIATWKRSGLDKPTIAAMAGHVSIKTAWRHYAPAKRGWARRVICNQPDLRMISAVRDRLKRGAGPPLPQAWVPPEGWSCRLSPSP